MALVSEKRLHPRIDLTVPVKLVDPASHVSSGSRDRVLVGNAVSLNVSARGVYVRTFSSYPLSPGMRFGIRLVIPESVMLGTAAASRETEYLNATLEGTGRIVRVERVVSADVIGVGVAIEFDRPLEFSRLA